MFHRLSLSILSAIIAGLIAWQVRADDAAATANARTLTAQAWTLDEALGQLEFNPDDAYLQYVALQLARNQRRMGEVARKIDAVSGRQPWRRRGPAPRLDLFDLFAGASAVQESLQLDAMRDPRELSHGDPASPAENTVRVAGLSGPRVESHPWGKMLAAAELGGKQPQLGPLDRCVPEDQYYVVFRSLTKLLDAADAGDLWGSHLFSQAAKYAKSQRTSERLKAQLAIQTEPLLRPFYDTFVDEVAVTGGDLFFREGSDVTMLFRVKQPELFRRRMDGFLDAAARSRPDAVRSTGRMGAVDYESVTTPDRAIHVFSAYPRSDLHVRSNSKPALERVLAAVAGGRQVPSLGASAEFRYIRTLLPRGAKEEDGLIYLSDPFIRRLVGPDLRLTERRRLICYNHLRMIGHAAMLYRTQYGKPAGSLDELVAAGCAPALAENACPCGGKYSLADDGATGVCSCHGNALELVPCRELALQKVTPSEAQQYQLFVDDYRQYWRQYFDPIAVRIQVAPTHYRAETIVLPLIDNSIYTTLATALGGEPEPLDALPVPPQNIFSVAVRLNKEELLKHDRPTYGFFHDITQAMPERPGAVSIEELVVMGLGNQVGMHFYDAAPMFDFDLASLLGELLGQFRRGNGQAFESELLPIAFLVSSLNRPVYLAIPVRDAKIVDKFLDDLDVTLAALARHGQRGGWIELDHDFYHVAAAGAGRHPRCYAVQLGPVKWRVFFERIEGGLYIASKRAILDDIAAVAGPKVEPAKTDNSATAHGLVRVRPQHWKEVLPDFRLGWAEGSRQACLNNLASLGPVARALAASGAGPVKAADLERAAGRLYGVYSFCPDGGHYEVSADGREVRCSVHGTAQAPRQTIAPASASPIGRLLKDFGGLTAELTFLDDGLHAVVTIDRGRGQRAAAAKAPLVQSDQPAQTKSTAADHFVVARALARRGQLDEAIEHYQKALEMKPDWAEAHSGLASVLMARGRYAEATAHYQAALKAKPNLAEARNGLGMVLAAQGRTTEAIAQFRKALEIKPDFAEAHNSLASALAGRGRIDEAIAHYQMALEIRPDFAEAHNSLASALAGRGQIDEAIVHYQRALKIKPDFAEAHNSLASALAASGRIDEAIAHCRRALEIKPDYAVAHFNLAKLFSRTGRLAEATAHYRAALRAKPNWAEARNGLGMVLAAQGRTTEAIAQFRKALEVNPKDAEAKENLDALQAARGEKKSP